MQLLIIGLISLVGSLIALALKEFTLEDSRIFMNKDKNSRDRAMYLLATSILLAILGVIMIIHWYLENN